MKKNCILSMIVALVVITAIFIPIGVFAAEVQLPELLPNGNPLVNAIYTADPSAHVWPTEPDKLYLYPSRDQDPAQGCDLMDKYHVYSTVDMVNWVDEGEIINSDEVAWGRSAGGFMWAPDAAYKDGTYYFFFPHPTGSSWGSTWEVGVATSKYPNKDFVDQGPVKGATTRSDYTSESNRRDGMIDPNVFFDDDGTPYMFIGGSQHLYYGEMTPDLLSMKGEDKEALIRIPSAQVPNYHEGPWVFKRNGIYYLTYPGASTTVDGKRSDRMLYSTSDSVHGPWVPRGYFHNPVNTGDTSHGSVVQFKGRWFLFYHNAELSGGTGNIRSVAMDELFFNEDGTIQMVVQTATGPAPIEGAITPVRPRTSYPVSAAELAGASVKLVSNDAWPLGPVISDLELNNTISTATFSNVDGGLGGRATIAIRYAAAGKRSLRLVVNGYDWGYINMVASSGINVFNREVEFTVTNMMPGATNTVQLIGRPSGSTGYTAGPLNIAQISSIPFNDGFNPDAVRINGVAVTSPLGAGFAANVKVDIKGQNLAGKTLKATMFGMDAVEFTGTDTAASVIVEVPASVMSTADMLRLKQTSFMPVTVTVDGEKAHISTPVAIMPFTAKIWTAYTENIDDQLRFLFNGDIQGSKKLGVSINGKALNAANFSIGTDNTVQTNVPFESITEDTDLVISGVRFPMFLSYEFKFSYKGLNPEPPMPADTVYNISTNGPVTADEEVFNLVDNDIMTKWYTDHRPLPADPLYVTWNYKNPLSVSSVIVGTANDSNGRDPRIWTISGSNDGENFTVFYSHSANLSTSRRVLATFNFEEPVTYKYFKLEITNTRSTNQGTQMSEFRLVPTPETPVEEPVEAS